MDWLLAMPVAVKVLGALALILVLNGLCRYLAVALTVGAVVLALWSGHAPDDIAQIAWARLSSLNHLSLIAIVFQVTWLSSQMAESGVMRDLVETVRSRVSQRAAMGVLPAVIGLLPMPGGALFSAPLVGDCDRENTVPGVLKTQINYWYRHVWEYWWPLYPGVLLALEVTKLEVWQIVLLHVPVSIVAILVGRFFLLRQIPQGRGGHGGFHRFVGRRFLKLMTPVFVIIGVYTVARLSLPTAVLAVRYLPMMIAIAVAMLVQQWLRPLNRQQWRTILLSRKTLTMALLVALVRVYGAFIEAPLPSGQLLVDQMRTELAGAGVPVMAVIMLLPFISGLATGLTVGYVGASFPIVFSLLGADPALGAVLAATVLAYGFGHMGMILSPVHICLIVTNQHFSSQLPRSIAGLVKPALAMMVVAVVLYLAIRGVCC